MDATTPAAMASFRPALPVAALAGVSFMPIAPAGGRRYGPPMLREGSDSGGSYVLLAVKAVPGARRDEIAGTLGQGDTARLKVRVSAPPEGGKANKAICRLIAGALGVRPAAVEVARGHASPEKTVRIRGLTMDDVRARLAAGK